LQEIAPVHSLGASFGVFGYAPALIEIGARDCGFFGQVYCWLWFWIPSKLAQCAPHRLSSDIEGGNRAQVFRTGT
jgi:hypothetical protein